MPALPSFPSPWTLFLAVAALALFLVPRQAAHAADPASTLPPDPVTRAESTYRGWKTVRLANGLVRLEVAPQLGGRVLGFALGDAEFFWVNPDLAGQAPPPEGLGPDGAWLNYGGDKLWPAPQGWDGPEQWPGPPDAVLDGGPYDRTDLRGGALRLASAKDPRSGLQFGRVLRLRSGSSRVLVEATMRNTDTRPRRWSLWSVTQLDAANARGKPNDRLVSTCPLNPRSRHDKGYRALFGPADNPAWQPDSAAGLFRARYRYRVGKAVLDSPAGWVATVDGARGLAFVQRFTFFPDRDYADNATVEFWHNGAGSFTAWGKDNVMPDDPARTACFVECELIGPLTRLEPNASSSWNYEWAATTVGLDAAVTDCTAAGLVLRPLFVRVADGRATWSGHWGVFDQGRARGILFGADGRRLAEHDLGDVTPRRAFLLDRATPCPKEAVAAAVEVLLPSGGATGYLGQAPLKSQ